MEEPELYELLIRYNHIFKDTDEVYHRFANAFGLSNCAFWILYLLRETDLQYTQAGICERLLLPRQTVNSALKNLQASGYIRLESDGKNQKNKFLHLTLEGEKFAASTIDQVFLVEQHALKQFSPQERKAFIEVNEKYCRGLREAAAKIISDTSKKASPSKPSKEESL